MHLNRSRRKNGRVYVSIVHTYRKDGRPTTKTVRSLGYLDELEKQFADPIAHFTKVKDEMEAERLSREAPVAVTLHPLQKIRKGGPLRKNLGFCALSKVYHELELDSFFENRQTKRKIGFSLNSVCKLLAFGRIISPASKKATWEARGDYFERFDFSLDDLYHALPIFYRYRDQLLLHLHKKCCENYGRSTELAYYDVTNYFFETDGGDGFREKGVSKEHRADPIVSMGLLLDANALPITYKLSPGNTNDCETLIPVLGEVKKSFGVERIVVVGDKAMNSSDNTAALLAKGDGYVFSKSVRGGTDELKAWAEDGSGYAVADGGGFAMKSRICVRTLRVTARAADKEKGIRKKTKGIKVTEKQVCIWSAKYDRRAKAKRQNAIDKARAMVDRPSRLKAMFDHSAARFVSGVAYDAGTGEPADVVDVLEFNEAKLAEEERYDGYYIISTSETDKSDADILDTYKGLWRIEDSFRVTKSDLEGRPVYVRLKEHIEAHFLTCFIALLILRILELKTGRRHSVPALISSMRKACATANEENWWRFDFRDSALDDLGSAVGVDFSRLNLQTGDIRKLVASTKRHI